MQDRRVSALAAAADAFRGLRSMTMSDMSLVVEHLTDTQIREAALKARAAVPLSSHGLVATQARRDPVGMLLEQEVLQRRDPDLLSLRHGRMVFSPFTFFRGAARIMAHDLARTPQSGLTHIWICGDAHLCNFGLFASPERTLVFDLNDFDETARGPFEWDVKRLAASFVIAGQNNGFSEEECNYACLEMLRTYRESIHSFTKMTALELFYTQMPVENALNVLNFNLSHAGKTDKKKKKDKKDKKKKDKKSKESGEEKEEDDSDNEKKDGEEKKKKKNKDKKKKKKKNSEDTNGEEGSEKEEKKAKKKEKKKKEKKKEKKNSSSSCDENADLTRENNSEDEEHVVESLNAANGLPWSTKMVEKALNSNHQKAFSQLVDASVPSALEFKSDPPILVPMRDLLEKVGQSRADLMHAINDIRRQYRKTLSENRRHLLEQYQVQDFARKVVGVGSVGTRCFALLLASACNPDDVLILQMKEATRSVIEEVIPDSPKFSQHAERVVAGQRILQAQTDIFLGHSGGMEAGRSFYWRQMKDMKGAVVVDKLKAVKLAQYARICGWTLARAHCKSANNNGRALAYYLGETDEFDRAILQFANAYSRVNKEDYEKFVEAVNTGRIEAIIE